MARVTAKVDDTALLALIRRTSGPSAIKRVEARVREEAEAIAEHARNDFPLSRWGNGSVRDKKHAADTIRVVGRVTPTSITYSVVSDSPYIYFIRSFQIKESESDQRDRFRRRPGESDEDYASRRTVGRRQHAWTVLVTRPGRRVTKRVARDLAADLRKLAARG
jgi:hypothetical protein